MKILGVKIEIKRERPASHLDQVRDQVRDLEAKITAELADVEAKLVALVDYSGDLRRDIDATRKKVYRDQAKEDQAQAQALVSFQRPRPTADQVDQVKYRTGDPAPEGG